MELLGITIYRFLAIYSFLLLVRIILTWFQTQNWAQQIIFVLSPVTDPYLNLFRSVLPPLGGFDLSPILALITLNFIYTLVGNALGSIAI